MCDKKRLIEVAFPLKQTSIDSVHEKNVRHGHISTLPIWPARRPLAAGLGEHPGFDLLSRRPSGEERAIEIKGQMCGVIF